MYLLIELEHVVFDATDFSFVVFNGNKLYGKFCWAADGGRYFKVEFEDIVQLLIAKMFFNCVGVND